MNMFLIGVLVGAAGFGLLYTVMIISKLHAGMMYLHQSMDNITKAVNITLIKLNKIEKVTDTTMSAAENFVDALRESAEQMMNKPFRGQIPPEGFDDIKKSFEEGIRRFEENEMTEEEDDDENEGKEDWQK